MQGFNTSKIPIFLVTSPVIRLLMTICFSVCLVMLHRNSVKGVCEQSPHFPLIYQSTLFEKKTKIWHTNNCETSSISNFVFCSIMTSKLHTYANFENLLIMLTRNDRH